MEWRSQPLFRFEIQLDSVEEHQKLLESELFTEILRTSSDFTAGTTIIEVKPAGVKAVEKMLKQLALKK